MCVCVCGIFLLLFFSCCRALMWPTRRQGWLPRREIQYERNGAKRKKKKKDSVVYTLLTHATIVASHWTTSRKEHTYMVLVVRGAKKRGRGVCQRYVMTFFIALYGMVDMVVCVVTLALPASILLKPPFVCLLCHA